MHPMANCNWEFCDISVNKNYDLTKLNVFKTLGYNTVAINTFVEEPNEEPKKKKKKGETKEKRDIPLPLEIPKDVQNSSGLNILQRLTLEFSDSSISHKLNQSENLRKYDILAVIPRTLQAFHYACTTMDVDLISFEPETRLPFKVTRKLYQKAIERGVFFELMYSPAIKDSTSRKNIISTAHIYHAVGKSKNIIVTSNAENSMQVRDVHDVINLGFILGLNSAESLEVIRRNARRLIVKSEGRKCGKHYMTITPLNETSDERIDKS